METRECTKCGETKKITEFPKNGKFPDGSTRWRNDCKVCYAIQRKLTKQKSVTKFLNNSKHRTKVEIDYNLVDWQDAMIHFKGSCSYCGEKQSRKLKMTRDHLTPVSEGGQTVRKNILPACGSCNSSKGNSNWKEWFLSKPFFDEQRMQAIEAWSEC